MGRKIQIDIDLLERILNCMCTQKYLPEMNEEYQDEHQEIVDRVWNKGMLVLSREKNKYTFWKYMKRIAKEIVTGRNELG